VLIWKQTRFDFSVKCRFMSKFTTIWQSEADFKTEQLTNKIFLAGHLGGFRVNALPPIISSPPTDSSTPTASVPVSIPESDKAKLCHFKRHIVQLYNQAGVKGEKIIFLLHDDK